MQYRRAFVPGASYFFTVVTDRRRPMLASANAVEDLRNAFRAVRKTRPFEMDAIVVLPDYLHCIWTLPPGDADFSTRWRLIKTRFTQRCDRALLGEANPGRQAKHQQAMWQHRYWEHLLRDENDAARHIEYIHFNPVKHGYAASVIEWPYSSFKHYVAAGIFPEDWGQGSLNLEGIGHE